MKRLSALLSTLFLAMVCHAGDLQQQYEKACYLEKAKGQVKAAVAMYQEISNAEPTPENSETIKQSLLRLLEIGRSKNHEPTIRDCHEKLLSKTDFSLQDLIDLSIEGSTIYIPNGVHNGAILISKDITLQGSDTQKTVLQVTSDKPLIHITKKLNVQISSLTLKSERETSERKEVTGCALYIKDAKATVQNCSIEAIGTISRCPVGISINGFSKVELINNHFFGYEYTIQYGEGSEGTVKGCIVERPGHCGFTAFYDSAVIVEENIFAGSGYHAVRSTGGTIYLKNNLIIANKNRGVYLGSKSAHGEIINNAIIGNGSGISAFGSSDVEIENNIILNNGFSGIDTRSYGKIQVKNNIIAGNKKTGFAVFEDGSNKFKVSQNTFFDNGEPSTDYKLPSSTIEADPEFTDPDIGDFSVNNSAVKSEKNGLIDSAIIMTLWNKYMEFSK